MLTGPLHILALKTPLPFQSWMSLAILSLVIGKMGILKKMMMMVVMVTMVTMMPTYRITVNVE